MNHLSRVLVAPVRLLAAGLVAAAVVLVVVVPAALAVPVVTGTFSGPGAGDGLLAGPGRAAIERSTGNLFVADGGNDRVQVFQPNGDYLTQFSAGLDGPSGLAVAVSGGQTSVYVSNTASGSIAKFDSDEAATPSFSPVAGFTSPAAGSGAGELGALPVALAVDPASGDLLVADQGNARVSRYQSDGTFVSSFTGADSGTAFSHPLDVAVDSTGDILVVDATGTVVDLENLAATSRVERFSSAGVYETPAASVNTPGLVAVDPDGDRVVVVGNFDTTSTGFPLSLNVFEPDGTAVSSGSLSAPTVNGLATGLAAAGGGSDQVYAITDLDAVFQFYGTVGGQVLQDVDPPAVTVSPASDVTTGGATLHGTVDAQGFATTYHFDYSLDGGATWTALPVPDADGGSATDPIDVQATLAGIDPNTAVRYRLVATNAAGTVTSTDTDPDETFTTLQDVPAVVTGNASSVITSTATLHGTVNPYGLQSTYHFEYGTTSSYGSRVPASHEAVAGNGRQALAVSQDIKGLEPGTTYHYRLVANSSEGDGAGGDRTFTTDAAARPVRGYEMVSPLDSGGINADDDSFGAMPSDDGNAVVYTTDKAVYPDASSSGFIPRVLGRRTDDGWTSQSLEVPTTNAFETFFTTVLGVSEDSRRTFLLSSRSLGGEGVEGDGNMYIHETGTGRYTLVATSPEQFFIDYFSGSGAKFLYIGGSRDLSTVAFLTTVALTPDATGNVKTYVWTEADGLRFVSSGNRNAVDVGLAHANEVSQGGRRVYVDDEDVLSLYEDGQLTPVSVNQRTGEPHTPMAGKFDGASPDGRYVLFTSTELLTDDATSLGFGDAMLYRYDLVTGHLEFLSNGLIPALYRVVSGPPATANGDVYFTSYFPQPGTSGSPIYLYHAGQGEVDLVASEVSAPVGGQMMTSPNGRYLAFAASSGLELYDARTKELVCVSCRPDGRPSAAVGLGQQGASGTFFQRHLAQSVTDDGQVFFDTRDPLVAADVNGVRDVYAYHRGRVELISRGKVGREAIFVDATPSGSDVFFVTEDRLVGQDDNATRDLYDARIGGGLASQAAKSARVACGGSECREPETGASGSPPTASERVDAAPTYPGSRSRARVSVVRSSFTSKALRLTLRVSGRGRVRVAGAGVVATGRSVSRAGRVTLKVPLTGKARAARRAGRRVRVVVRVSLAPPFGASGSLKLTRTLGR